MPALDDFQPGQRWRLLRDHGTDYLALKAGSEGVVRELVPADVPGAHNDHEDAVVLEFEHPEAFMEAGEARVVLGRRAVAFAVADFEGDDALLEEA